MNKFLDVNDILKVSENVMYHMKLIDRDSGRKCFLVNYGNFINRGDNIMVILIIDIEYNGSCSSTIINCLDEIEAQGIRNKLTKKLGKQLQNDLIKSFSITVADRRVKYSY